MSKHTILGPDLNSVQRLLYDSTSHKFEQTLQCHSGDMLKTTLVSHTCNVLAHQYGKFYAVNLRCSVNIGPKPLTYRTKDAND